jgi:FixJ family two-component response regulator
MPQNKCVSVHIVITDPATRTLAARYVRSTGQRAALYRSLDEFIDVYEDRGPAVLLVNAAALKAGLDALRLLIDLGVDLPIVCHTRKMDAAMALTALKGGVDVLQGPLKQTSFRSSIEEALDRDQARRAALARQSDAAALSKHADSAGERSEVRRFRQVESGDREGSGNIIKDGRIAPQPNLGEDPDAQRGRTRASGRSRRDARRRLMEVNLAAGRSSSGFRA